VHPRVSMPLPAVWLAGLFLAVPVTATGQPQTGARTRSLIREAQHALESGNAAQAERYFKAAVAADPASPEAMCGLGQTQLGLRQYEEAARALQSCKTLILDRLRRLQSQQAEAYTQADQEIREIQDTIRAIQTGVLQPSDPGYLGRLEDRIRELQNLQTRERIRVEVPAPISLALGTAYLKLGQPDLAENELLAALRVAPGLGEAHQGLAAAYLAQGRWDECAEHIRLAEEAGVVVDPRLKIDLKAHRTADLTAPAPSTPAATPKSTQKLTIENRGRTCAVNGMFVHLEASITPSWGIHDPVVHFRTDKAQGWYSMTMLPAEGDRFAVTLPRPRGAKSFRYYIDVSNYDDTSIRTDESRVRVVKQEDDCPEAAADSKEAAAVLIVEPPRDVADAAPVPDGFSIRGTTADMGVLEIGSKKALLFGGAALAGAAAAGVALFKSPEQSYDGPMPFEDLPGIAFVNSDPPPGSTLLLRGGTISVELQVYSLQTLPGARITAELVQGFASFGGACIALQGTHDLAAGITTSVVLSGPTTPIGGGCDTRVPIEQMRVWVVGSDGLGGFRTGIPPLNHIRVHYDLAE
jgi:Tfp pilus assembly protein PilF